MLKVIALCLCVALAVGQVTFGTPTLSAAGAGTATTYTQGILVKLTAPGWVASDPLSTLLSSPTTTVTVIATLVSATGTVGVGLTALGNTGACTTSDFTTQRGSGATMLGKAAGTCPADFLTVYTAASVTGSTTTSTVSGAALLAATKSARWAITSPGTAGSPTLCHSVVYTPPATTGTGLGTPLSAVNSGGTCATASASANQEGYMKASLSYAFYVELEASGTAATVCLQTTTQFTASPGACGTPVPTATTKSVTFSSPTISQASSVNVGKVTPYTQGTMVTFTAPGFIISDTMTDLYSTASSSFTVYTTVVSATGANVGVGLTAVANAATTCTATDFATQHTTPNLMLAKAAGTCPSDFLTAYSAAQTGTQSVGALTTTPLAVGKTAKWWVIAPSTVNTGCNTLIYTPPGAASTAGALATNPLSEYNPAGVCPTTAASTSANQEGYFVATKYYAFYAELEASGTAASVCFQNPTQFAASAGNCGTVSTTTSTTTSTSSAAMVSAIMAPIMLVILMFFN